MSFLHTAFPSKKHAVGRKSISSVTEDMSTEGGGSEETGADFWPVQHPIEPPLGEKPVECPMPHSSVLNELRVSRRLERKDVEPTSKRRHSVSHDGDHYKTLIFNNKYNFFRNMQHSHNFHP